MFSKQNQLFHLSVFADSVFFFFTMVPIPRDNRTYHRLIETGMGNIIVSLTA